MRIFNFARSEAKSYLNQTRSGLKVSPSKTLRLLLPHGGSDTRTQKAVHYSRSMQHLLPSAVLLALLLPVVAEARDTGFINRKLIINGSVSQYRVYIPETYTPHPHTPIILVPP